MSNFPHCTTLYTIVRAASKDGADSAYELIEKLFDDEPNLTWDDLGLSLHVIWAARSGLCALWETQPLTRKALAEWTESLLEAYPEDAMEEEEDDDEEEEEEDDDEYDDEDEYGNLRGFVVADLRSEERASNKGKRHRGYE